MEPVTIAAITGALTALASEVAKGAASEAGKEAWAKLKGLLGVRPQTAIDDAQKAIADTLETDPEVLKQVIQILQTSQSNNVSQLVGSIDAEKVVVVNGQIGTVNM